MIRIVIIDGQDSDRSKAEVVLSAQNDFQIVGVGKDGYDAITLVEICKPDIVLLDIDLPDLNGVKVASILKCRFPNTSIIIFTYLNDDKYALNAICNGVSGYLLKNTDMEKLAEIIRVINDGGCHISPYVAAKVFPHVSRLARKEYPQLATQFPAQPPDTQFPANLSRQELQITNYVGLGLENQEIAKKLFLKIGTIRNHITVILQKTSLRNRTQLAVFAVQNGLTKELPNPH
ncbi:response regulator [Treponema primitia]|uniref:response regulator n=1 Tax=Treponema primitia TaxID=88058 RepID=UPI0002554D7B|nr:response regulator transcription factor [Treponema primitia]